MNAILTTLRVLFHNVAKILDTQIKHDLLGYLTANLGGKMGFFGIGQQINMYVLLTAISSYIFIKKFSITLNLFKYIYYFTRNNPKSYV